MQICTLWIYCRCPSYSCFIISLCWGATAFLEQIHTSELNLNLVELNCLVVIELNGILDSAPWTAAQGNPELWGLSRHHFKLVFSVFPSTLSLWQWGEREACLFSNSATLQRLRCVAFQHAEICLIIHPNTPLIRVPDQAYIFFLYHLFKWQHLRFKTVSEQVTC